MATADHESPNSSNKKTIDSQKEAARHITLDRVSSESTPPSSSSSYPTLSHSDHYDEDGDDSSASSASSPPRHPPPPPPPEIAVGGDDPHHDHPADKFPRTAGVGGGFYSGRHPVPRIQSYWELYPGRANSPSAPSTPTPQEIHAEKRERRRKVEENSSVVTDPITGKKYAPAPRLLSFPFLSPLSSSNSNRD